MVSQFSQCKTQSIMGFGRPSWPGPVDLSATLTMSHFSWGPRYPQFLPVPSSTPITCHTLLLGTSCPTQPCMHMYLPNTCFRAPSQAFPPVSLLCTPVLHLPTPVTVRLPPMYHSVHRTSHSSTPTTLSSRHFYFSEAPHHPVRYSRSVLYIIALVPWTLSEYHVLAE